MIDLNEIVSYAQSMLVKYGLKDWEFNLNNSYTDFGSVYYDPKIMYISTYHIKLNTELEIKRTILHEIAHVLHPKEGHNQIWKSKFEMLLVVELGQIETITTRFGKGKMPRTAAQRKELNKFKLVL